MDLETALLRQMPDVVVVIDGAGRYAYVSPSIALYGFEAGDMLGRSNIEWVHPEDREKVQRLMRALLAGRLDEEADRQYRVRLPDGRTILVEGRPSLLFDGDGEPIGYLTVLRDITARPRPPSADGVGAAARRLLNHEIRTPLNGVLAACELLQASDLPAPRRESLLRDIARSADHLARALAPFLGGPPAGNSEVGVPAAPPATPQGRLRILAVDDHPLNLRLIEAIVEPIADVVTAGDGQGALEAFRGERFDVVLLDVQMPIMDGLTALRAIRSAAGPAASTPVIMVTANAAPEDEAASREAGATLHMAKPIQPARLLSAIRACAGAPVGPT